MKKLLPVIAIITFLFFLFFKTEAQISQTVSNATITAPVNFPFTGCTYKWVNNTPSIGLPDSGVGNIASFKAINDSSGLVIATITATPFPTGYAYIASGDNNYVYVIDTTNNEKVDSIAMTFPLAVSTSPDGRFVYVTNDNNNGTVSVIGTATNSVIATIRVGSTPWGIAVSPDGSRVYVANNGSSTVSVINATNNSVVATISVGSAPWGIAVSPDGSRVYVANDDSNTVSVINTTTNSVVATIPVGTEPIGVSVSPNSSLVYVTNSISNTVSVIDISTYTVIATIPVGTNPMGLSVSPKSNLVYVTNTESNTVSVINISTNTVIASIPVGSHPTALSVNSDGSLLYVVNASPNSMSVINTLTNLVISTISISANPDFVGISNFISASSGCNSTPITFTITVMPAPSVSIITSANSICMGTAVTFTASSTNGGNEPAYQWVVNGNDSGHNSSSFTCSTLNNGDSIYCITTSSVANTAPVSSAAVYMTVNPLPTVFFQPDTFFIKDNIGVQLTPSVTGVISKYKWSPADGLSNTDIASPVADPINNSIYQLLVTTDSGCTATGKVSVIIARPIEMPSAFTPNGDGHNDIFRIPQGAQLVLHEFDIFDRWGNRVFITNNIAEGWSGRYNGKPSDVGAYVYIIKGNTLTGELILLKGTFILIR